MKVTKPRILFISHSYPPTLGGVESQNYYLSQNLKKLAPTTVIANGKGKVWLPIFIPLAFLQALFMMRKHDVCLVGSGILAPVALALKLFHRRQKYFSVVHGLDITYCLKPGFLPMIYKNVNIPSLKKLTKLFMVGNFTIDQAVEVGVPRSHCVFIPNGVTIAELRKTHSRLELSELFGSDTTDKKVLLRIARFVPHKGVDWFINNVMPALPENVVLIATGYRVPKRTAGDPDIFENCQRAIKKHGLEARVKLLPTLPQVDLVKLLNTADLVVAPNVRIPGSSEGFGINVIEAGACERTVLASDLEGLADAIKNGENGFLVEPGQADQWVAKINELFGNGSDFLQEFGRKAGHYVEEHYSWEKISQQYLEEIEKAK